MSNFQVGDNVIHVDPFGRTKPQLDEIDEVHDEYAHGPIIGWVKQSSLALEDE
jgi:hypothetical protein